MHCIIILNSDLHEVDGEDSHSGVDTEALQAGQEGVGPDKEGDHVSEGGDAHSHPRVLHRLSEPFGQRGRTGVVL